jgi:hypothetical protein
MVDRLRQSGARVLAPRSGWHMGRSPAIPPHSFLFIEHLQWSAAAWNLSILGMGSRSGSRHLV